MSAVCYESVPIGSGIRAGTSSYDTRLTSQEWEYAVSHVASPGRWVPGEAHPGVLSITLGFSVGNTPGGVIG
jgi:hypothetical protein